jgi:hypothetical protein
MVLGSFESIVQLRNKMKDARSRELFKDSICVRVGIATGVQEDGTKSN